MLGSTREQTQVVNRTLLASTISALLAGGGAAQAQQQQQPSQGLEEITVTGSRIVRRDLEASSPIVTIDAARFESREAKVLKGTACAPRSPRQRRIGKPSLHAHGSRERSACVAGIQHGIECTSSKCYLDRSAGVMQSATQAGHYKPVARSGGQSLFGNTATWLKQR